LANDALDLVLQSNISFACTALICGLTKDYIRLSRQVTVIVLTLGHVFHSVPTVPDLRAGFRPGRVDGLSHCRLNAAELSRLVKSQYKIKLLLITRC
jgi:hypothetical protein